MYIATYFSKDLRQLKGYPKEKPNKKQMREKKEIIESGHKNRGLNEADEDWDYILYIIIFQ